MGVENLSERQSEKEKEPLLDFELEDGTKVIFSEWDSFNPQGSKETLPIPDSIAGILNQRYIAQERAHNARENYVFENTVEEEEWEAKIFKLVEDFLKGEGINIARNFGVNKLDSLEPKQLFGLSLGVVRKLTKYNDFELHEASKEKVGDQREFLTYSDQCTAMEILEQGLENLDNPNWIGNGACRTFASTVKTVFSALKARQSPAGTVKNSYCLYEMGFDYSATSPFRTDDNPHAWNVFLNVDNPKEIQFSFPDITWANFNEEDGRVDDFDYTLPRAEPIAFELARAGKITEKSLMKVMEFYGEFLSKELVERVVFRERVDEKINLKPNQLDEFFKEYDGSKLIFKVENYEQLRKGSLFLSLPKKLKKKLADLLEEREDYNFQRSHFLSRALTLVIQNDYYGPIPESLISQINKIPGQQWENKYLETLWKLSKHNQNINIGEIMDSYVDRYSLFVGGKLHNPVERLVFKDDELQMVVYEKIRSRNGFENYSTWPGLKERLAELLNKE